MAKREALFLILLLSGLASAFSDSMTLELRRRDFRNEESSGSRIRKLIAGDVLRSRMILQKLSNPHARYAAKMSLKSAADSGAGQYLVTIKVGTPAQVFSLIADTGSDLTWLNCGYNNDGWKDFTTVRRSSRRRRIFHANASCSFKTIPCLSRTCKSGLANLFSLSLCPTHSAPCAFDYRYFDGSSAAGVFANETVTLNLDRGGESMLHDVVIGCAKSVHGESFRSADGVLGMAFSPYSFASVAARTYGGKFSYCLVDHLSPGNVSGFLTFGERTAPAVQCANDVKIRYTPLVLGVLNPFYAVQVRGISVGDEMLAIPREVWNAKGVGGTIFDSGTSLTTLTTPAYRPVIRELRRKLGKFPRVKQNGVPLEYCFNSTGFQPSDVSTFRIHFEGGAAFQPPVKSYVIDVADGVKCLGFVSADWPGPCVIGNIIQQNHVWQFDILRGMLGFARSDCT